ncbi:MAG: RdgB/HAM1 family non-canonical purine NTP pyrophosphatase [Tenericutes bacterium]|nr:RdgB/HAM1 family non-canonical purine NTP pyrophosphatase [Mycoplasmatota bacterium]
MKEILLATKNPHKLLEFSQALKPFGYHCVSLEDIGFTDEIIEDGTTFFDNAYIKAKTIALKYNKITLADDSGLVVIALPEELGVKSKRFSKSATDSDNNTLLLKRLKDVSDRSAYFVSQIVIYYPDGKFYTYQGRVYGHIAEEIKGINGFGYDPLFEIEDLNRRMAELSREEKNMVSHRGNAIRKLVKDLKNEVITL